MKKTYKIVAILLVLPLIIVLFPNLYGGISFSKAEEYRISNPQIENGMVTWDCIYFGNYWQNDTNGDGTADKNDEKEPIKWRVLSVDGDNAFLLADCNLDAKPYNEEYTDITWEFCTLRSWLNGYGEDSNACGTDYSSDNFIDAAFSPSEQTAIFDTVVVNEDHPYYRTEGGNDTTDKVYLLSIAEASNVTYGFSETFNTESKTRVSTNTAYVAEYSSISSTGSADLWSLRSPGAWSDDAARVRTDGSGLHGDVDIKRAVRPTLHLNLSSNLWSMADPVIVDEDILPSITHTLEPTTKPSPSPTPTQIPPLPTTTPAPSIQPPTSTPTTGVSTPPAPTTTSKPIATSTPSPTVEVTASPTPIPTVEVTPAPPTITEQHTVVSDEPTAINITKPKNITVKNKKKNAVRLSWGKVAGANGYQIQYSTSKKFTKKIVKTTNKTKLTIKKLKKNKNYYFRIRAYRITTENNQQEIYNYSSWSKVKNAKIK